ncbi:MAG TPA: DUF1997 domain-containing protein [Oscillatoriaceae cyanobacterium M33_DOE_052]|uniref:DUF1997 domain-containing protein n=1 Tax=Planktothricoides sp. SpSt-374 TaxID=2282167 RepID=A0A7C3ZGB8_9CYAN|nr:DUF1997 domain-containing protein [Oscillatoriaceae cyanobacterium M33_DOE_052]
MYYLFTASQSVKLAVSEQKVPIERYLRQPQRIVRGMGDPSRIQQLGEDCYRLKMRPLKFFMLTIEPTVDMEIWADANGTINLQSVGCELRGIETINEHFQLELSGTLQPVNGAKSSYLQGGAELQLKIYLPPPFTMMPAAIVRSTGNSLLSSVLLRMKQKLMQQILLDYEQWAGQQTKELVAA